jgi:MoxR-like ATPase
MDTDRARSRVEDFRRKFDLLQSEIAKEIVGYEDIVQKTLIALFASGHVLLEGVQGSAGRRSFALAKALALKFSRIQFSPDLMPADIVGTTVLVVSEAGEKVFRFQRGPIFGHLVLADEINRATPKTQSALLEAMQEHSVTVGGTTHRLEEPFFVLGTQNPIEMEGTYPLPEAQIDRFLFKLEVGYLDEEELLQVIDRTTSTVSPEIHGVLGSQEILTMRELVREVPVAEHVKRYAVRVVRATHPDSEVAPSSVKRYVKFGSSPRGIQALMLAGKVRALVHGRFHLACEDVRDVAKPALRHRLLLNFEGEAEDMKTDLLLDEILASTREMAEAAGA